MNPWNLTQRQVDVLELACSGLTSKEIGYRLQLSPKTVDTHFDRAMDRMPEARTRWHAVLLWDRANREEAA